MISLICFSHFSRIVTDLRIIEFNSVSYKRLVFSRITNFGHKIYIQVYMFWLMIAAPEKLNFYVKFFKEFITA